MNSAESRFEQRCHSLAVSLGLCRADDSIVVSRLSGGVASDIARVELPGMSLCMKFALDKLKVEEDWFAPVQRGRAEYAWLSAVRQLQPEAVPALHGWSDREHGFAMEFLDGPNTRLWKNELLAGRANSGEEAAALARLLGSIHAASTQSTFDRQPFDNMSDFESLRLEPYLRFTATRHDTLSRQLNALADRLAESSRALVHGDVSPKNILFRDSQPILLDAECASMGDPVFDVAFLLNHLLLKSFHRPADRAALHHSIKCFQDHYQPHICWEDPLALDRRLAELLPAMLLARVDGKSPVEYLNADCRDQVRQTALGLLQKPRMSLGELMLALDPTH